MVVTDQDMSEKDDYLLQNDKNGKGEGLFPPLSA